MSEAQTEPKSPLSKTDISENQELHFNFLYDLGLRLKFALHSYSCVLTNWAKMLLGDLGSSPGQVILAILFSLKSPEPFYSLTILDNVYSLRTYLRDVIYTERWGQLVSVTEWDLICCPFQSNLSSEEEAVSQSVPMEHIMRRQMSVKLRTPLLAIFCSAQPSL